MKSFDTMEAVVVGKTAFNKQDRATWKRVFRIGHAFGIPYGTSITKLYRKVTENDY